MQQKKKNLNMEMIDDSSYIYINVSGIELLGNMLVAVIPRVLVTLLCAFLVCFPPLLPMHPNVSVKITYPVGIFW